MSTNKRNTNSDVVDFSNNTVSSGAILNNIVISRDGATEESVTQLLSLLEKMMRGPIRSRRLDDRERDVPEALSAFQRDWSLGQDANTEVQDSDQDLDPTVHYGLTRQPNADFRDDFFPGQYPFEHDLATAVRQYPGQATATVLQSLSIQHQQDIFAWAASPHSQLLWIDGCLDAIAESPWTTDLALEIVGTVSLAISRNDTLESAVLYHFCSPVVEGHERTPVIVLQDLIFQLVTSQAEKFTDAACREHRLTRSTFCEAAKSDNLLQLWKVFATCVLIVEVKSLVIIVSDLDRLSAEISLLQQLLDGLFRLSQTDSVQTKILVTTRPSIASDLFEVAHTTPPRQVLVKLPTPPDRRRPQTRQFRVPIVPGKFHDSARRTMTDSSSDDEDIRRISRSCIPRRATKLNTFSDDDCSDLDYPHELEHYLDTDSDEEVNTFVTGATGAPAADTITATDSERALTRQLEDDGDSEYSLSYSDLEGFTKSPSTIIPERIRKASLADLLDSSSGEEE